MTVLVEVSEQNMALLLRRSERLGEPVDCLLRKAVEQFAYNEQVSRAGRAWKKPEKRTA